jgi:serine acetyltransferase
MAESSGVPFPDYVWDFLMSDDGEYLREDVIIWTVWRGGSVKDDDDLRFALGCQFQKYSEFRSLFDYRLRKSAKYSDQPRVLQASKRATDLYILADYIGPRLRIQHGHSTWIMGRLGSDCLIRHNTTIGMHPRRGAPTLGNRVEVGTGAVIFDNIRVGDDVRIGPNAVVNFDVPDKSRVFAPRPLVVPM